jgi:hypothetical protein
MANTKDTLIIVPGLGKMDECKNAAGRTLGADATYGLDNASPTDAATFAAAEGYTLEAYAAATPGQSTIDTTGITAGEEMFVTLIDVTAGRRQFPRKTFRAATAAALSALIDDAELEVGDGKAYTSTEAAGVITVIAPADVICKFAANEDAVIAETVPTVLTVGLTNAKAVELVGNKITKAGRTNRVGFPVIEPSVFQDLGLSSTANYDMLTKQIIGDVKFDKNVGASYQDVENVTILMLDGASLTAS